MTEFDAAAVDTPWKGKILTDVEDVETSADVDPEAIPIFEAGHVTERTADVLPENCCFLTAPELNVADTELVAEKRVMGCADTVEDADAAIVALMDRPGLFL